jgi:hypothetical protein
MFVVGHSASFLGHGGCGFFLSFPHPARRSCTVKIRFYVTPFSVVVER